MNRTLLISLMIGTAMMITVIGQHEPSAQLDTMPWDVDRLDNDSLRVFGITLGKTSIQEANQIFARFAKTQLQVTKTNNQLQSLQLIARYEELTFGGLIAEIKLTYQVEQEQLEKVYLAINPPITDEKIRYYSVSNQTEMHYLNVPISSITYTPSIDYELETIQQNFGPPSKEVIVSDELQHWIYPDMGLTIIIHTRHVDKFIYALLDTETMSSSDK